MDKKPLISVIIPCYNAAKFIEETINSILSQTYTHYEIVCVNNNSSDATLDIIERLQRENPGKIVITHETKQNASAARMKGLKIARGNVIQFLDADDLIAKEKFTTQINKMIETNALVVVSDMIQKDELLLRTTNHITFEDIETNPLNVALEKFITSGNPLYDKTVVDQIGYDDRLAASQDFDFHVRMVLANVKFSYVPGVFFIRRCVTGSLSFDHVKTAFLTAKTLKTLRPQLEKRINEIEQPAIIRVCEIYYDCAVHTTDPLARKEYIEELTFWANNKFAYLSSPVKVLIAKMAGVPAIVALDAWRFNR